MVNIKDYQYLTQNLVHKFLLVTLEILPKDFPQNLINISIIAFCWILAQTRELGNQSC